MSVPACRLRLLKFKNNWIFIKCKNVLPYLDSKLVSVILNSWLALRTDDAMKRMFSEKFRDYEIKDTFKTLIL